MKNKANVIVIGLIALLTVASAYAQPFGTMRVSVPFQFLAGDKVMPAGEYRIEVDPWFHRMALRPVTGGFGVYLTAHLTMKTSDPPEAGMLVFHKYGHQYFLRAAWNGGELSGYELPPSRAEREIAKLAGNAQVASVRVK